MWKRGPDTQTGACPTQMDRPWGEWEPQAPAVLLDPFVDLSLSLSSSTSSICRPGHRRYGAPICGLALPRVAYCNACNRDFPSSSQMAPNNATIGGIGRWSLTLAWRDGKRDSRKERKKRTDNHRRILIYRRQRQAVGRSSGHDEGI
ncbi:hypothetical protein B0T20DRAFT_3523 [Sordaria brevicollis]|uniref:Uncharacterized protein n=1 Tax=Sordaria brevicollis TaxID=83679 RepID=A0AAE0PMI0_SORBR|nr:hypothetical protein B0T20DRAFT_3523 [Sordaria brevicollis]